MTLSVPTIAGLAAACLGLGYLLLGALALAVRERAPVGALVPVLLIETLIVAVVAISFLAGGAWLVLALAALAFRVTLEAARIAAIAHPRPPVPPLALAAGVGALAAVMPLSGSAGVLACAAAWLAFAALRRSGRAGGWVDPVLFPALPMLAAVVPATGPGTGALALAIYLMVEVFDSFALFFGKLTGRRKAFPRLSPGKTVEGLAGGAAALVLASAAGAGLLAEARLDEALALAALVAAAGLAGDLGASAIKRRAGVKDFPGGIPHQGGVLDIADSWIAATACLSVWLALAALF